jgi:LysM repeat protein
MKKVYWVGLLFVFFFGCRNIQTSDGPTTSKLTPYTPLDSNPVKEETLTPETETEPMLVPTATPLRHTVALGETFSSIGLQFGVTIDAIKGANPDINPNTLIVGDEVIIPVTEQIASTNLDPQIRKNIQFSKPNCVRSRDGGLWCAVLANNKGEANVEELIVAFSFFDLKGNLIEERYAPTLMNRLLAGSSVPAVLFLHTEPPNFDTITPSVFSVQVLDPVEEINILIEIEDEKKSIDGNEATLTGKLRIVTDQNVDQTELWIGAAAFDGDDVLVGVRRLESTVVSGELNDFKITVYAAEPSIAWVHLYSEAFIIE